VVVVLVGLTGDDFPSSEMRRRLGAKGEGMTPAVRDERRPWQEQGTAEDRNQLMVMVMVMIVKGPLYRCLHTQFGGLNYVGVLIWTRPITMARFNFAILPLDRQPNSLLILSCYYVALGPCPALTTNVSLCSDLSLLIHTWSKAFTHLRGHSNNTWSCVVTTSCPIFFPRII